MDKNDNREGSTRQLKNGSWECITQAKYLNPKTANPKRFKRTAKTEKEARRLSIMARDAWEKEYERGKDIKVDKKKTFGEYMDEYIETEVKPTVAGSTYHSYVNTMRANFDNFPIAKYQLHMLSAVEFESYYDTILGLKSRKTCSFPIQLTRRCCKWLVNRSLLKENYAEQARVKKEIIDEYDKKLDEEVKNRKEVFTPEDIEKFYYAYKNNMGQYAVVVMFILETGLRSGEFSSLRNDNIDFENNKIYVVESQATRYIDNDKTKGLERYTKVPKNTKPRFIIMSSLAKECAQYMMEQTKIYCKNNPDNLLYPVFSTGKRRTHETIEVGFKTLCDKLGVDRDVHMTRNGMRGLSIHSLRHTMDTIANSSKGANVINTALMMGHNAISVENIYTHATEEGLSSVTTPSQAILADYKKEDEKLPKNVIKENQELYEAYLKLKEIFE